MADQYYGHGAEYYLLSDADLLKWKGIILNKDDINNINQVIILTISTVIKLLLCVSIFII